MVRADFLEEGEETAWHVRPVPGPGGPSLAQSLWRRAGLSASSQESVPLTAQAARLIPVHPGLAWCGDVHATPEAREPLRGPRGPGPWRDKLSLASGGLSWLGCASGTQALSGLGERGAGPLS